MPFKKGQSGNPAGRKKGSTTPPRARLSAAMLHAFNADFEKNGPKVITHVRENEPVRYLQIAASFIPKEFQVEAQVDQALTVQYVNLIDVEKEDERDVSDSG